MKVYKNTFVSRESYFVKTGDGHSYTMEASKSTGYIVEFVGGKWEVREGCYLDVLPMVVYSSFKPYIEESFTDYERDVRNGHKGGRPQKPPVTTGKGGLPSPTQAEAEADAEAEKEAVNYDSSLKNELQVIAENKVSIKGVIDRAVINAVLDLVGETKINKIYLYIVKNVEKIWLRNDILIT